MRVIYFKLFGKFFVELMEAAETFGNSKGLPNESAWIVPGTIEA